MAYGVGYGRGKAAGSWVIDGNTPTNEAHRILRGIEEGDPAIMDRISPPDHWNEKEMFEVLDEINVAHNSPERNDILEQYHAGFDDGYWGEVERSARAVS
jgi:hypothetical protein